MLAVMTLLGAAGLLASLAATPVEAGFRSLGTSLALIIGALALVATVPALLDGRSRFWLAGTTSLALGIIGAAAGGMGSVAQAGATGAPLLQPVALILAVIAGINGLYHLLGSEPGPSAAERARS